jgi:hypothetical protein
MRLYLDDDMDANALIRFLQNEGHEVVSPRAVAMRGAEDAVHRRYAAAQQCAVVTANVRDCLTLHQAWQEAGRHHAGILASTGRIIHNVIGRRRRSQARSAGSHARDYRSRTPSILCRCGASPPAANDSQHG